MKIETLLVLGVLVGGGFLVYKLVSGAEKNAQAQKARLGKGFDLGLNFGFSKFGG